MADFQPPPTWASPVLVNEKTGESQFNPIWLNWFLALTAVLNAVGAGSGGIAHNDTTGLQGGSANQFYHLTSTQQALLAAFLSSGTTDLLLPLGTTGLSSLRIPHGAAPTSPVNGDVWTTTAGLFVRINGVTVGPLS